MIKTYPVSRAYGEFSFQIIISLFIFNQIFAGKLVIDLGMYRVGAGCQTVSVHYKHENA